MKRIALCLVLLSTAAGAQQKDIPLGVCQEQRNMAMNWHITAEAQRVALLEENEKLKRQVAELVKKVEAER